MSEGLREARKPPRPWQRRLIVDSGQLLLLLAVLAVWVVVLLLLVDFGRVSESATVEITGPEEVVFDWSRDACEPNDIPDAPARAFRDADGTVNLIASSDTTRRLSGPSLDRLQHPCQVVFRSSANPDPAKFRDREWITAPYTLDGRTVFALVHDEYQGQTHPGSCLSRQGLRCWYNSITLAVSRDGGREFQPARPPPNHLVASVPYRYVADAEPYGLFQPSSIVRRPEDGYFYSFIRAAMYKAQRPGVCLMRTRNLADPTAWRAWDGSGFTVSFANPYRTHVDAQKHGCSPVATREIENMTGGLTFNTYLDKYVLVGTATDRMGGQRGIYFSVSEDLVHWSDRKLIVPGVFPWTFRCGDPAPILHASLLDPDSKTLNFETTGRQSYLYFTRFHYDEHCRQTFDRDLIRLPLRFSK